MNFKKISFLFIFIFLIHPHFLHSFDLKTQNQQLDALIPMIGNYPPQIASKQEKKNIESSLKKIIQSTEKELGQNPTNISILLLLGDAYRMAHNLDWPKASENSEKYFKQALQLNPNDPAPKYFLSLLYLQTNLSLYPEAEKLLLEIVAQDKKNVPSKVYKNLVIIQFAQGKLKETISNAKTYLKTNPEDQTIQAIKARAEKGELPKVHSY